jgi:hypothetical protein
MLPASVGFYSPLDSLLIHRKCLRYAFLGDEVARRMHMAKEGGQLSGDGGSRMEFYKGPKECRW